MNKAGRRKDNALIRTLANKEL